MNNDELELLRNDSSEQASPITEGVTEIRALPYAQDK
jgi:hypothetical protein